MLKISIELTNDKIKYLEGRIGTGDKVLEETNKHVRTEVPEGLYVVVNPFTGSSLIERGLQDQQIRENNLIYCKGEGARGKEPQDPEDSRVNLVF